MKALVANRFLVTRLLNALTGKSLGPGCSITDVPEPTITTNEILVKVKAVALNPTDFKHIDIVAPPYSIIGCDFAGEVVKIGPQTTGWKIGDRVAGSVHGGLYPDRGSFAEYLKTDADLCWKVPSDVTDEQATTFGVSAGTAMMALDVHLQIENTNSPVLIYAGSTASGLFAIQMAKKAGKTVVTTASPHSFDLVKSYGADHVFDYRSPNSAAEIAKQFPNIKVAMDCFSEGGSTAFCADILKQTGGKVVTLLPNGKSKHGNVEYDSFLLYSAFGKEFAWLQPIGPRFPAIPRDREAFAKFNQELPQLAAELKTPPILSLEGGFEGIMKGLGDLRQGKVSGKKLVVKL